VRGIVRATDGGPVAGARVTLGETNVIATTDGAGRYVFHGLRSGAPIDVNVTARGFEEASSSVVVPNGAPLDTNLSLAPARTPASPLDHGIVARPSTSATAIGPETTAGVPSLTRGDVFHALALLPSAGGDLETSSELAFRGASPDQTLTTFDGFTLYPMTHPFGRFGALNAAAIEHADVTESATAAADGGRLGGAIRIAGATNSSGRPNGAVEFSTLGWSAHASAPVGDRAAIFVSARATPPTTVYDRVLDEIDGDRGLSARSRLPQFSGGSLGAGATSSFHDVNTKASVKLTSVDRVSLTVYDASDAANQSRDLAQPTTTTTSGTSIDEPGTYPALPADAVNHVTDIVAWTGRGIGAEWQRRWSSSITTHVSVGHSEFTKRDASATILASQSNSTDYSYADGRGGSGGLTESNRVTDTTVRADQAMSLGFDHFVDVGGEVVSLETSYGAQTEAFARLVPLYSNAASGRIATAFAQDSWRPWPGVSVTPGVRLSHYDLANATYVDPRASVTYLVGHWVQLSGAWSIDHQVVNRMTREDLTRGDTEFWALADGTAIALPRSQQVVAGGSLELPELRVDLRVYYKTLDGLTMLAPRLYPGIAPIAGTTALFQGTGIAKGLEAFLQHRVEQNTLWTSYAISRAENTFPLLQADAFPASYDQTHTFKVADTIRITPAWSTSVVLVAGSGRPMTPALSATPVWFPSGLMVNAVAFGLKNSDRLPPYSRLDISAQRVIKLRAVSATVAATVFNAYDRQNIATIQYWTVGGQTSASDETLMRRTFDLSLRFAF
jgi:hypothetical protein